MEKTPINHKKRNTKPGNSTPKMKPGGAAPKIKTAVTTPKDGLGRKYALSIYCIGAIASVALAILTGWLQTYRFTSLEEEYIMLYDSSYVGRLLCETGGVAQLIASMLTQFFIYKWVGAVITGLMYLLTIISLCRLIITKHSAVWTAALSAAPAICLMLCLENSAYEYQGTVAIVLNICVLPWLFGKTDKCGVIMATAMMSAATALMVWCTGAAAAIIPLSCLAWNTSKDQRKAQATIGGIIVAVVYVAIALVLSRLSDTRANPLTPAMYYDMGSTYYMALYAMASVVVFVVLITWAHHWGKSVSWRGWLAAAAVLAVEIGIGLNLYAKVHSQSNYENQQQRYYARHGEWDKIAAMPYDGGQTPYTSYIFLALAEKGMLSDEIEHYRPYISYLFENKPKVKKRDQQVYSDIYFRCRYMAAARHSAFDTNIVTPGEFNPYETQKLAMINMAYGDYAVADKMLAKLEKTLYYKAWARDQRKYLYNDSLLEADPTLGAMRRAIPEENSYLSPKGMMRDLKYVTVVDPDLTVAKEMYKAYLKLTNQTDDAI